MSKDLYFPTRAAKESWHHLMLAIEQSSSVEVVELHVSRARAYAKALLDADLLDRDEYISYSSAIKRAKARGLQMLATQVLQEENEHDPLSHKGEVYPISSNRAKDRT